MSELVLIRASQLRRRDATAVVFHRLDCRYVKGLESVFVSRTIAQAAHWYPCAKCKP